MESTIKFLISWGPAILFFVMILLSFLFGLLKGLRRTRIFFIHTLIALAICIGVYYFFINNKSTDEFLLSITNFFLGSKTGLQDKLGVSQSLTTFSEVWIGYLTSGAISLDATLQMLITENGDYVYVFVDLIYHIAFFILVYVLFWILKFIMWLTYIFFYSDTKYKKKNLYEVYANNTDEMFRPRRLRGGLFCLLTGTISAVISISLLGSVYYVASGGTKAEKLQVVETDNSNYNSIMKMYSYVEKYGNEGFFGALNSFADAEGNPYYLMIPDLVLQGRLNDKENGTSRTVYLRKELAQYVSVAKRTINLLTKYGGDSVSDLINGNGQTIQEMLPQILVNSSFIDEFKSLIYEFDDNSFIVDFSLNILKKSIENIDTNSFTKDLDENIKDVLQILFKDGYLSDTIPTERQEKLALEEGTTKKVSFPCLKLNNLITKEDVIEMFDVYIEMISMSDEEKADVANIIQLIIPHISKLSMFNEDKDNNLSPVLGRLYQYAACKFLDEGGDDNIMSIDVYSKKINNTDWVKELNYIITGSQDIMKLYKNIYVPAYKEAQEKGEEALNILDLFFEVFDETNENYKENSGAFDNLIDVLGRSVLLGEVLKTNKIVTTIQDSLSQNSSFEMPTDIQYANTYDKDGKLVSNGEISNLLKGVRAIATNSKLRTAIQTIMSGEEVDFISLLTENINEFKALDKEGKSIFDYLIDSDLLESYISAVFIDSAESTIIYIPSSVLVDGKNGVKKHIIKKDELKTLFNNLPTLLEMIDIAQSSGGEGSFDDIIYNSKYDTLLNNCIVQGTVGKLIVKVFENNDTLILPNSLKNPDEWVNIGSKKGELSVLINFVRKSNLSIDDLTSGSGEAYNKLLELTSDKELLTEMLESKILHYTISNVLDSDMKFDSFTLIVPTGAKTKLSNDSISYLIDKKEIINLFQMIDELDIKNMSTMQTEDLIRNIEKQRDNIKNSLILTASIADYIINSEITDIISIPRSLDSDHDGSKESLKQLDKRNGWYNELYDLLVSLEELFDITTSKDFRLDDEYFESKFVELLNGGLLENAKSDPSKTVIDVCYSSDIISYTLTKTIDQSITTDLLKNNEIRQACKQNAIYKIGEIKSLLNAIRALGVNVDDLETYDFMAHLKEYITPDSMGETILDKLYDSTLVAGIITEEIRDILVANPNLVNYELAYRKDVELLKKSEIKALISVLGNSNLTTSFTMDDINLSELINIAFTKDGDDVITESYLIVACISKIITTSVSDLVIPLTALQTIIDGNTPIIKSIEIYNFFTALESINITDIQGIDISSLTLNRQSREAICNSNIMIATVVKQIKVSNNGTEVQIKVEDKKDYAYKTTDIQEHDILMLTKTEMSNFLEGLVLLSEGDDLVLNFNMDISCIINVASKENGLENLLKSSIMHIAVSDILISYRNSNPMYQYMIEAPNENYSYIYLIALGTPKDDIRYSKLQINTIIGTISASLGG